MENKISDIARILDKKPSVLLSILREIGVEAPNMNSVLTEEEENRLYIKMGLRQKKKTPVVHADAEPEDDSHIKKTVIVQKKVTVVTKKQYDDHMKNKVDVPSAEKPAKPLHVSKEAPKKEHAAVTHKVTEKKEKAVTPSAEPVVNETKPAEPVKVVKEKAHHVKSEVQKETPVKEETSSKAPDVEERRYVKIDKDEINKHKKDYNRSSTAKPDATRTDFRKPFDPNRTDFRKPFDPNRTDFRKPFDPNRTDFRKPADGTRTDFRKPADGTRTDFRKPFDKDSVETKKTFDRDKKDDTKKSETTIKAPKNKKGDHKKDFDKAFNKPGTVKKVTKTPVKSEKYKTQTFIPGQKRGVNEILSEEFIFNEYYSNDNIKKRRRKDRNSIPKIEVLRSVKLPETMTVKFFAETIKKQVSDVIMKLMSLDVVAGINDDIDFDTASLVAGEYKIEAELEKKATEEDILFDDSDDEEDQLVKRPPVVVVMGHVDHGKTSLLDTIKKTNVVATEAGSITQHIGAYMVNVKGRKITFLDTPGHEAFTAMRKRGADVTDIAIIVVAADDGIMPQTIEAINHAKAAEVAVIIAINKIDVRGANVDKVMQELTTHGLVPEVWGGDVVCVPVSAKTGENIDNLLDMINLTADILELKANPDRQAKGTIIEARVEKSGVIATLLVKRGTLKVGDAIISGTSTGRIKAMNNDVGQPIESAGPSVPAEILGLDEAPEAGDVFYAVDDLKTAKSLAERRKYEQLQDRNVRKSTSLEDLFAQIQEGQIKDLNIIVKGDVRGSVEAVTDSLHKISNDEVQVKVIHGAVGTITESDISLAEVTNAIIIGFNVRPNTIVSEMAKEAHVDIRLYRIIYNAIEDIEAAIKGMLTPKFVEAVKGHAEAREIFKVSNVGTIAGCMVTDGKIERNSDVRVLRDGVIIFEGRLSSLKRFKDDVKEVASGYECGISVEKFNDIKQGDIFETFKMEEIVN